MDEKPLWSRYKSYVAAAGIIAALLNGQLDLASLAGLPSPKAKTEERRVEPLWQAIRELRQENAQLKQKLHDAENDRWRLKLLLERAGIEVNLQGPLQPE